MIAFKPYKAQKLQKKTRTCVDITHNIYVTCMFVQIKIFNGVLNSDSLTLTIQIKSVILKKQKQKTLISISCVIYRKFQKSNKTNRKTLLILVTGI